MLEIEYAFFNRTRNQLVKEHSGEWVVIKGEQFLGFFSDDIQAIRETLKNHPAGTFAVQKCIPLEQEIQKYYSRVSFA